MVEFGSLDLILKKSSLHIFPLKRASMVTDTRLRKFNEAFRLDDFSLNPLVRFSLKIYSKILIESRIKSFLLKLEI